MFLYHALDVIRAGLAEKGFSEKIAKGISEPQRDSMLNVYQPCWLEFCRWCYGRLGDPLNATVPLVCDFLMFLFEEETNKKGEP